MSGTITITFAELDKLTRDAENAAYERAAEIVRYHTGSVAVAERILQLKSSPAAPKSGEKE